MTGTSLDAGCKPDTRTEGSPLPTLAYGHVGARSHDGRSDGQSSRKAKGHGFGHVSLAQWKSGRLKPVRSLVRVQGETPAAPRRHRVLRPLGACIAGPCRTPRSAGEPDQALSTSAVPAIFGHPQQNRSNIMAMPTSAREEIQGRLKVLESQIREDLDQASGLRSSARRLEERAEKGRVLRAEWLDILDAISDEVTP